MADVSELMLGATG